jgi:HEAT repeat protein
MLLSSALLAPTPAFANETRGTTEARRVLSLIDQLRDEGDWKARMEAAVALGRSSDIRATRPLENALHDPHYAVRIAAIRSLTNVGDARAIPSILERLDDDEPFVRREARAAIDVFDVDIARPYFIHALRRSPSVEVRLASAERLASDRTKEGLRALLDAIGDDDAIGRFAIAAIRSLPGDDASDLFLEGLDASDYGVQVASIRALDEIDTPRAIEPLIRLLDSEVAEVTIAATDALGDLADRIDKRKMLVLARRASSRFERARAMKVLGIIGGEDAALLLLNALDDPDVLVRGAAVAAIANLEEVRAIPKLLDMKKNEANGRIIALVRRTLVNLKRIREKKA